VRDFLIVVIFGSLVGAAILLGDTGAMVLKYLTGVPW
jgi:hypothetical protein